MEFAQAVIKTCQVKPQSMHSREQTSKNGKQDEKRQKAREKKDRKREKDRVLKRKHTEKKAKKKEEYICLRRASQPCEEIVCGKKIKKK